MDYKFENLTHTFRIEKTKEIEQYLKFQRKLHAVEFTKDLGWRFTSRGFNVSESTVYNWLNKYDKYAEKGLLRKKRDQGT